MCWISSKNLVNSITVSQTTPFLMGYLCSRASFYGSLLLLNYLNRSSVERSCVWCRISRLRWWTMGTISTSWPLTWPTCAGTPNNSLTRPTNLLTTSSPRAASTMWVHHCSYIFVWSWYRACIFMFASLYTLLDTLSTSRFISCKLGWYSDGMNYHSLATPSHGCGWCEYCTSRCWNSLLCNNQAYNDRIICALWHYSWQARNHD